MPSHFCKTTLIAAALALTSASWAQSDPAIAAATKEAGAVVTKTGLVYRSLADGKGASPVSKAPSPMAKSSTAPTSATSLPSSR
jgi:hypothetical protein